MRTILCLVLLSMACAWGTPPVAKPRSAAAPTQQMSDTAIEAAIRTRFQRSKIRVDGYTVHVQGGVATIEGKTKVIQRKGVATRLAKLGGARAVNNRIEVDEAARQKAADNLEQGRRRAQVKRGEIRTQTTARSKP